MSGIKQDIIGLDIHENGIEKIDLDGFVNSDITDRESLVEVFRKFRPDNIYHLAAQSSVAISNKNPEVTFKINQTGTLNLFEAALKELEQDAVILLAGSGDIYKSTSDGIPLTEEAYIEPTNAYSVSKAVTDFLGSIYYKKHNLKILRARSFNHIGPGQNTSFVMPSFAEQIADIEAGNKPPVLKVGNLEARRDFSDVKDVVNAYRMILEKGRIGEAYNVCSSNSYSINELLQIMLDQSEVKIDIEVDPKRLRSLENPILVGDNSKLKRDTGWQLENSIQDTLTSLLDHWRVKKSSD